MYNHSLPVPTLHAHSEGGKRIISTADKARPGPDLPVQVLLEAEAEEEGAGEGADHGQEDAEAAAGFSHLGRLTAIVFIGKHGSRKLLVQIRAHYRVVFFYGDESVTCGVLRQIIDGALTEWESTKCVLV